MFSKKKTKTKKIEKHIQIQNVTLKIKICFKTMTECSMPLCRLTSCLAWCDLCCLITPVSVRFVWQAGKKSEQPRNSDQILIQMLLNPDQCSVVRYYIFVQLVWVSTIWNSN